MKFPVFYADPPWHFKAHSDITGGGRGAIAHYPVMSIKDIKALPIADMAEDDATLMMWVPDTHLAQGFAVLKSWGFTYKTVGLYWAKTRPKADLHALDIDKDFTVGMGYWTRANPEQCWLATRGKPKRVNKDVRRLIVAPRREHSRKPDEAYDRIERLVDGPYLELFARQTRPNWTAWGNQTELFDNGTVKTRNRPSGKKEASDD